MTSLQAFVAEPELDAAWPPASEDLSGFPSRSLSEGRAIYRLHRRELGPFWFASTAEAAPGGNRFDLAPPRGASYWALEPVVAVLETLARRPVTLIPAELVDRFALTSAPLPRALERVANLPVKAARRFGLTAEIHTTTNRRLTRAWAAALDRAGFSAVLALPRHDVTGRHRTLTLWGSEGEHPPYGWDWRTAASEVGTVAADLRRWGITVVPIPFDVDVLPWPGPDSPTVSR